MTVCLLVRRQDRRSSRGFPVSSGAGEAGLGALDQQVALELGDGVDDIHRHLSRRIGQVDPAKGEALHTDTRFPEPGDDRADIDGIATQPVEFGDDRESPLSILSRRRTNPGR